MEKCFCSNQSSASVNSTCGYLTPPRNNISLTQQSSPSGSTRLFPQPKLLTSAELQQRFSPLKKRRRHLREVQFNSSTDGVVPLKRVRHMPVIFQRSFDLDEQENRFVSVSSSAILHQPVYPQVTFDTLLSKSLKKPEENSFTISESILEEKLQTLTRKA